MHAACCATWLSGERAARGAQWTTIRFLKLYGDFSSLFMVKNGSETPRHGDDDEDGFILSLEENTIA
jgi:hypothetical protein